MKEFSTADAVTVLLAGAVVLSSLAFAWRPPDAPQDAEPMGFWEAAARELVSVTQVDHTFQRGDTTVTLPVGIRVENAATVPVVVSEEAVLMSPHPSGPPPEDRTNTTQDAVLTNQTIPAGGSLTYFYGQDVLQGDLSGPTWWCAEEFQFSRAGVRFYVGGETLPFAIRPVLSNLHYEDEDSNTQADFWTYLKSNPSVVVGKEPLWARIEDAAGQRIAVTIRATNLAIYTTNDEVTADVNVTGGAVEDLVPAGWSVEEGSFSTLPSIIDRPDGSRILRWTVDLPAAFVSEVPDPRYPVDYVTRTFGYVLVSPDLQAGKIELPRATSDMDRDGIADAQSAPPVVEVTVSGPIANAGGPYAGAEGSTIDLNASKSSSPEGRPLQFRWDFTDDGTYDTEWSASPISRARYTDDFAGFARVEVSDGRRSNAARAAVTITNLPPEILGLQIRLEAEFRIAATGERWHDVALTVTSGEAVLGEARVAREPGSPSEQSASAGVIRVEPGAPLSAIVAYTPEDDPVNGQTNGDNPVQLILIFVDDSWEKLEHNFNVQKPATWTWTMQDLAPLFAREGLTFRAPLRDPGSDGLRVSWDFGDGTSVFQDYGAIAGVSPTLATAIAVHAYAKPGDYEVRLSVEDDDGGRTTASWTIRAG